MQEDPSPRRDGSHATGWWLGVTGAMLLYFLSPPPLAWVYKHFAWATPEWPRYVYSPIILLCHHFEPVREFYRAYAKLMGVVL